MNIDSTASTNNRSYYMVTEDVLNSSFFFSISIHEIYILGHKIVNGLAMYLNHGESNHVPMIGRSMH